MKKNKIILFILLLVNIIVSGQNVNFSKNQITIGHSFGFHGSGDYTVGTMGFGYQYNISNRWSLRSDFNFSINYNNPFKEYLGGSFKNSKREVDLYPSFLTKDNLDLVEEWNTAPFFPEDQINGHIPLTPRLEDRYILELSLGAGYSIINKGKNKLIISLNAAVNRTVEQYFITGIPVTVSGNPFIATEDGTARVQLDMPLYQQYVSFGLKYEITYQYHFNDRTFIGTKLNAREYFGTDLIFGYGDIHFGVKF